MRAASRQVFVGDVDAFEGSFALSDLVGSRL